MLLHGIKYKKQHRYTIETDTKDNKRHCGTCFVSLDFDEKGPVKLSEGKILTYLRVI